MPVSLRGAKRPQYGPVGSFTVAGYRRNVPPVPAPKPSSDPTLTDRIEASLRRVHAVTTNIRETLAVVTTPPPTPLRASTPPRRRRRR